MKNNIDQASLQKEFKMKGILMHPNKYQEMMAETAPQFISAFKPDMTIHEMKIIISPDVDENQIYIAIDYTRTFEKLRKEIEG